MREVEDYLRFVGRLHDVAGVDPRFLDITGLAFSLEKDFLMRSSSNGMIGEGTMMVRKQYKVGISMKHPRTGLHDSFNENDIQGCI